MQRKIDLVYKDALKSRLVIIYYRRRKIFIYEDLSIYLYVTWIFIKANCRTEKQSEGNPQ